MGTFKSVLVVDDNGINRLLPGLILRPFGWTVYEADSGMQALQILENFQVGCILLDITMPDVDGLAVLSQIQENNKFNNLKKIAYTANFVSEEAVNESTRIY